MKLGLLCIGRLKDGPERHLVDRYAQRIGSLAKPLGFAPIFDEIEVPESRARRDADRRAEEAKALLIKAPGAALIAFNEKASSLSSEAFAALLSTLRDRNHTACYGVIGGADGLDEALKERVAHLVSFGRLTIPHQLVRVLATEQIYRAITILQGHPYHRGN